MLIHIIALTALVTLLFVSALLLVLMYDNIVEYYDEVKFEEFIESKIIKERL